MSPACRFPARAPVAQLDRAPDYESGGQRFESFRARHLFEPPSAATPTRSVAGAARRVGESRPTCARSATGSTSRIYSVTATSPKMSGSEKEQRATNDARSPRHQIRRSQRSCRVQGSHKGSPFPQNPLPAWHARPALARSPRAAPSSALQLHADDSNARSTPWSTPPQKAPSPTGARCVMRPNSRLISTAPKTSRTDTSCGAGETAGAHWRIISET